MNPILNWARASPFAASGDSRFSAAAYSPRWAAATASSSSAPAAGAARPATTMRQANSRLIMWPPAMKPHDETAGRHDQDDRDDLLTQGNGRSEAPANVKECHSGRSKGSDHSCAIAHRRIARFRVSMLTHRPGMTAAINIDNAPPCTDLRA